MGQILEDFSSVIRLEYENCGSDEVSGEWDLGLASRTPRAVPGPWKVRAVVEYIEGRGTGVVRCRR